MNSEKWKVEICFLIIHFSLSFVIIFQSHNIIFTQIITELNFDVLGYCGAGAPRFNVVTSDNVTHFFGCTYGTHTALAFGPTIPAAQVVADSIVGSA